MTTACEVLIVGAGPAGSSLAWRLQQAGIDVAVMDKRAFPRDKVCAGWITPAVVQSLGLDVEDYRQGRVFQPISGFRVGMLGARDVGIRYPEPVSFGIRRCEFDAYLLQRSGARQVLGEPLKQLRREGAEWVVNERLRARLVVGAGGHFCPVARAIGAKLGRSESVVAAQEIEFPMTPEQQARCSVDARVPELYFCADLQGYGWVFRKGDYLNVGLGREDNHRLAEHVEAFRSHLIARGKIPPDTPSRFHGHAYLLYGHAPRALYDDGVLLIGDAAGLAYPQSGEGIRPAVESALLAAQVILKAQGDYRSENLAPYARDLAARFGSADAGRSVSLVPPRLKQVLARRLLATRWFARRVVMDQWFLHRDQPALRAG